MGDYLDRGGSGTQPGWGLIGRSARPDRSSAFRLKTCPEKSEEQPIQTQLRTLADEVITKPLCLYLHLPMCACVCVCVSCSSGLSQWRLWEMRYFTWRCSGPRRSGTPQRGLWWCRFSYSWPEAGRGWKLRFRDRERGETECKKERLRSPARINSKILNCKGKKKAHELSAIKKKKKKISSKSSKDSCKVRNYLCETEKLPISSKAEESKSLHAFFSVTSLMRRNRCNEKKYLPETVFLLMKMLLSGSPSFHSCWQFPSIS